MREVTWILAVILTCCAGWTDARSRRIPNWLTVSGLVVGIVVNSIATGWHGTLFSLEGLAVPLLLLLPPVLMRGLGAGDWKLMGSLGAILGIERVLVVLLATILLAGIIAIFLMVKQRRVLVTLRNMWEILRGVLVFGVRPNPEVNLDNPNATSLPFGVMAGLATVLCYCAAGALRP